MENNSNIFIDRSVFTDRYTPDNILFRREQIDKLIAWTNPAMNRARANNILCLGDYGTGKTSTVSYIINNMSKLVEHKQNIGIFWINCAEYSSARQKITTNRLFMRWINKHGGRVFNTTPTMVITDKMKELVETFDASVFVLDEIDEYLCHRENDFNRFAYLVSRSFKNANAIMMTNKFWVMDYLANDLDARTTDTFTRTLKTISFGDYTQDELYHILKARCEVGLKPNVITDDVIRKIAQISYNQSLKARGVMNIALWSGELAEREGYNKIETWMAETVTKQKQRIQMENVVATMDTASQNIIFYLYKNKHRGWINDRELLEWFCRNESGLKLLKNTSEHTFYLIMTKLRGMEIVERELVWRGRARGTYGRVRIAPAYIDIINDLYGDEIGGNENETDNRTGATTGTKTGQ